MLDDEHGVAGFDKSMQHLEQHLNVGEVEARGRLVEQIKSASSAFLDQLPSELDPLGLAAGERGRSLAELEIIEADVVQGLQLVPHVGNVFEQRERLLHIHLEDLRDAHALEANLQRLAVESLSFTDGASDPHVGEEVHFEPSRAVSFASFAATAADVEAEPARLVAASLRLRQLGVEIANVVEDLDVRRWIGARRAADRRLIDGDQLVEMLDPFDLAVRAGFAKSAVEIASQGFDQYVAHQRAFARAGNPGHADKRPERNFDIDIAEVVVFRADDAEHRRGEQPAARGWGFVGGRSVDDLPSRRSA